jgi:anhydro-N-acetylmuramic acid kinase
LWHHNKTGGEIRRRLHFCSEGFLRDGFYTTIGLMSGTSLDGIDAAVLATDGESVSAFGSAISKPYDDKFKSRLKEALGRAPELIRRRDGVDDQAIVELEHDLTTAHGRAVHALLREAGMEPGEIDVIGFHGQTLYHAPEAGLTWQLGDANLLAAITGIDVVGDFRSNDMAAGGQGAPLVPVYHLAVARDRTPYKRFIFLNIGGVANLTWIDLAHGGARLVAFDTGPGNALLDDWMLEKAGQPFDNKGKTAFKGKIDRARLDAATAHNFFDRPPPKSLDRNTFSAQMVEGLELEDGAATLTAFTVAAVQRACTLLPAAPEACFVTGGGRHNPVLMAGLSEALPLPVEPVETIGLRGDSLEAELMAFLAARSLKGLPLTFPETTGARSNCTGGRLCRAPGAR